MSVPETFAGEAPKLANRATSESVPGFEQPARQRLADGHLEAIKWIALVAMTADHVNTYLLAGSHQWMYHVGRLAMPLFGFVFAANLARPGTFDGDVVRRMSRRLAIAGIAAQIPFSWLRGGPWHPTVLNVIFTLLLVIAHLRMWNRMARHYRIGSWALLAVAGAIVEFWWIGVAVVLTFFGWFRKSDFNHLAAAMLSLALLSNICRSPVPLLTPVLIYGVQRIRLKLPRMRSFFYLYYPAHLAALAVARMIFCR